MDVAETEARGKDLAAMIRHREDKRRESEGERRELEAWQERERRHAAQSRATNRAAWAAYHRDQAERHRRTLTDLVIHHETQAERYRHHQREEDSCSTRKTR